MVNEKEICRDYRNAKHKCDMVQILSELNCIDRKDVIDILINGGEKVRINIPGKKKRVSADDMTDEEYARALFGCLERLDERIRQLEREYREILKVMESYWR